MRRGHRRTDMSPSPVFPHCFCPLGRVAVAARRIQPVPRAGTRPPHRQIDEAVAVHVAHHRDVAQVLVAPLPTAGVRGAISRRGRQPGPPAGGRAPDAQVGVPVRVKVADERSIADVLIGPLDDACGRVAVAARRRQPVPASRLARRQTIKSALPSPSTFTDHRHITRDPDAPLLVILAPRSCIRSTRSASTRSRCWPSRQSNPTLPSPSISPSSGVSPRLALPHLGAGADVAVAAPRRQPIPGAS